MVRHVLSALQFDRPEIESLFDRTDWMKSTPRRNRPPVLLGKTVALIFYEPSTRTRMSFERAAVALGADTIGTEAAGLFSSASKGESLPDTVEVLSRYEVDAIVLRHKESGASHRAAAMSPIPIINAGDGAAEHPTQALLDLYTILRATDRQDITLALSGDLEHSRTVRSLCRLLIRYGGLPRFRLLLVSPTDIRLGEDIRAELSLAGIPFEETDRLGDALPEADVFYQTRVQRERFKDSDEGNRVHREIQTRFALTGENVNLMKPDAIIMHPLPRLDELDTSVDANPRARYFDQAANGYFLRMALLERLLASDG